ncbi:MAG: twin-arginine translocase TatA/TatE family subunit [Bdellovibrionota bacterium]
MFGLGFGELIVILVVALLVFGPDKLPEVARTLGKTAAELRRAMDELKHEMNAPRFDLDQEQKKPVPVAPTSTLPAVANQGVANQSEAAASAPGDSVSSSASEGTGARISEPPATEASIGAASSDPLPTEPRNSSETASSDAPIDSPAGQKTEGQ